MATFDTIVAFPEFLTLSYFMKSAYEKVRIEARTSVALLNRRLNGGIPFEWHHHPEFELTLTMNSQGHRFVGDHFGAYEDGDLVLLGPNLSHTWCSSSMANSRTPHVAIVAWFPEAWARQVTALMPELNGINALLTEARRGIHFSAGASQEVRSQLQTLPGAGPDERLLTLLEVLRRLASDEQRQLLSSGSATPPSIAPDARLQRVLNYLHANFHRPVEIGKLAKLACLSPSALHRMFRRHTHLTPIAYTMRLRIGGACSRLMEDELSIAAVAAQVGYTNIANFNRQFRAARGVTPRQFRDRYHGHGKANK